MVDYDYDELNIYDEDRDGSSVCASCGDEFGRSSAVCPTCRAIVDGELVHDAQGRLVRP